jgi:hypothetical protein
LALVIGYLSLAYSAHWVPFAGTSYAGQAVRQHSSVSPPAEQPPTPSSNSPTVTSAASPPTTESYDVVCNNPVTLNIGAYADNGVITIRVTGVVDVTGSAGQKTLTVSGPAGSYYITSTADPGAGAQGVWINSQDPSGSCYSPQLRLTVQNAMLGTAVVDTILTAVAPTLP